MKKGVKYIKTLLVLPPDEILKAQVDHAVHYLLYILKMDSVELVVPEQYFAYYDDLTYGRQKLLLAEQFTELDDYDVIVFQQGRNDEICSIPVNSNIRIYTINHFGTDLVHAEGSKGYFDYKEYPYMDKHIFNRLSPKRDVSHYYAPYGYYFRYMGFGPLNEFGHRIKVDLSQLEKRAPNHKVVAVFGGSAAWGYFSLFEEMFPSVLEKALNKYCQEQAIDLSFTVLNFAQHAAVVINGILNYLLLCHRLKPDVVIAHDGFNDMFNGQVSDNYLLTQYDMTYYFKTKKWSIILNDDKEAEAHWVEPPRPYWHITTNSCDDNTNAYFSRTLQFQELVENAGAIYMSGLEPLVNSKKAFSPLEKKWCDENYIMEEEPWSTIPAVYEDYLSKRPGDKLHHFINFHEYFNRFGADSTLFFDTIHTTRDGEAIIADVYSKYFQDVIIPLLLRKEADNTCLSAI